MKYIKNITLDVYNDRGKRQTVFVKQGDTARSLKMILTASGEKIIPADSDTAAFRVKKRDGHSVDYPVPVEKDGTITIPLSAQAVACDGRCFADVYLLDADGAVLSSANFDLMVEPVPRGDGLKSEDDYGVLLEARKRAEEAAEQTAADKQAASELAEQAAGSAGAAAGSASQAAGSEKAAGEHATAAEIAKALAEAAALLAQSWARGETGSRDGEDEDNAKYYAAQALIAALQAAEAAEDAQRVAQGAVGYYKTPELLREKHPSAEDGNWAIVGSTDTIWVWDSDSGDWTNSGNKIDLSQYYTRTEVDDLLTGLEETMTEAIGDAASRVYTVTVPASGWTAPGAPAPTWQGKTAKWVNTVSVPGMTETANIPQGCVSFTSGSYTAAGQWTWLEQGTDTATFYADGAAAPAADFTLRLTEVR